MEKNKKIFMQSWLQCHPRTKITSTDAWYLDFANRLFPVIDSSELYVDSSVEDKQNAAVMLTLYLEDCVADDGGWRRFSDLYHNLYGSRLPFFEIPEEYITDEINEVDIAFILWKINTIETLEVTVADPFNEKALELAARVYTFLDEAFEQAPVCDVPSGDWVMSSEQLLKERTPLPEIKPDTRLSKDIALFLEATGGYQLMYFALYEEMEAFFVKHLHWKAAEIPDKMGAEMGNIVVYANAKGLLVAPVVSWFFCDERNDVTYDPVMARNEGFRVFTDKGYCPFDLLKYAIEQNLFPEAQFPFENGKELLWNNWDFVARYFLGEFYEGR